MIKRTEWNILVDDLNIGFKDRLFKSRDVKESELNKNIVHDYIDLPDIDAAVFEITTAIQNKKRIMVFGDYDVDGTMATTIIVRFFRSINYPITYHIPDRMTEGYGISDIAAEKIIKQHSCDLIITVDNGIAAIEQIKKIMDAGIKVVVTDHHECKETLPPACAVVDCKRPDNQYPFNELCGAGVAMKLVWALCDEMGLPEDSWKDYLEYAAIATVADIVPLVDENRSIVKNGIEMLKRTNKPSISNLLRAAGRLENIMNLTASDIGFYVGPLINASSRIGSVHTAMELLLTDDMEVAIARSDELKELNEERKKIETNIYREANMSLVRDFDFNTVNPIIVCGENWHKGVIGIVASRIVEAYSRPAIVLSKDDNGKCHGSCRTYGDINIIQLLDAGKNYLTQYGGHAGAAGLTLEYSNIESFRKELNAYASKHYTQSMFSAKQIADIAVSIDDINIDNFNLVKTLEPFGASNHDPVFVLRGAKVASFRKIGQKEGFENAHLKLTVKSGRMSSITAEGVGFYNSEFADVINVNDEIDIMFKPSINEWQDKLIPQMQILDIHCNVYQKDGLTMEEDVMYREDDISIIEMADEYGIDIDEYIPSKQECFAAYKALCLIVSKQTNGVLITDMDILSMVVSSVLKKTYISPFKLSRIIEINSEAGYFYFKRMPGDKVFIALTDGQNTRLISDTDTYRVLQEEKNMLDCD